MKIVTTYAEMTRALNAVLAVVSDKLLQEDLRTLTFWKNGDVLKVVANNAFVSTMTDFDGELEFAEGEEVLDEVFVQLKVNDLKNILATYSNLHVTEVESLVFDIRNNEIRLEVHEEAVDKNADNADKFSKVIRHKLMRVRVTETMKRNIHTFCDELGENQEYIQLSTAEILGYIEPLLPAVTKMQNDGIFSRMYFLKDYIFIIPQTYAAVIDNRLDDEVKEQFSDFVLTNSVASFFKTFFGMYETVEFRKKAVNDIVNLVVKTDDTTAMIRAFSTKKVPNISEYNIMPENFISLDRYYFSDVLKRISNSNADATFKVVINGEDSSLTVINKGVTQSIPINKAKGEGEYCFTLNSELLASLTFNNMLDCYGSKLVFRFATDDKGKVNFYVMDDTKGWHTKMQGLTVTKTDFQQWDN